MGIRFEIGEERWYEIGSPPTLRVLVHQTDRCRSLASFLYDGWHPVCRVCYPGVLPGSPNDEPWRTYVSKFIKRSLERAAKLRKGAAFLDAAFAKKYPALTEFLTCEEDEGQPRKTATISMFWGQGQLRAFLNDRETSKSLCVVAERVDGLWEALEATLTSDDPPWRDLDAYGGSHRRKKA